MDKPIREVSEIRIEKSFKIEKESLYLIIAILSFVFIFILVLFFGAIYLLKPEALLSPPSINSFLASLNDSHKVVVGDKAIDKELDLINKFSSEFNVEILKESEPLDKKNKLMIGISKSFTNTPYLEYLSDNDSIVIYNSEENNLYVYSKDLDSFEKVLDILKSDSENLEYSSIKINKEIIEELIIG